MKFLRLAGRWLVSRTVREATESHRHIRKLLRSQRDLLAPETVTALTDSLDALRQAWQTGAPASAIRAARQDVQTLARQGLDDPSRSWRREACEMLLVALTVVMAARSFFLQPMKIPTGSMQPTLFGVTAQDLKQQPPARIPTGLRAWVERWVFGRRYFVFVAQTPGRLTKIEPPEPAFSFLKYFPLLKKQRFQVGETWYTLWLPPSDLPNPLGMNPDYYAFFYHAGLLTDRVYRPGEVLVRMRVARGDNLLVDRFTYNFRRPRRGEILVFRTEGVPALQPGTHYIKRLVGLSGEKVRLGNDRHAIIDGQRLDATTPHFENVYSFTGPPRENQYSGHVNDLIARLNRQPPGTLASLFPRETSQFAVRPRHYFLLGDNTMNSYDSRRWGDLPQERVIGKFCLVYWPLSHRFGWGQE